MINKMQYVVYSCIFAIFFAAYIIANSFPDAAASYPHTICMVGMILTLMLIVDHLIKDRKVIKDSAKMQHTLEELRKEKLTRAQFKSICIFMGMLFSYIFLIDKLGYFSTTIIYLIISMTVFHKKFSWVIAVVAVGFTGVMYLVFDQFLHLLIPSGILF